MATAADIARTITEEREALASLMKEYKTGEDDRGLPIYKFPDGKEEEIYKRQDKLAEMQDAYQRTGLAEVEQKNAEALANLQRVNRQYVGGNSSGNGSTQTQTDIRGKTLGNLVAESWAYKNRAAMDGKGRFSCRLDGIDVKTLLTTAGSPGFVPPNDRTNLVVPYANRRPMVADLIPTTNTNDQIVKWMEQVTFTNNASQVAEGGQKPESALDWDEKTVQLRTIAHWIPVTKQQVDFVPQLVSLIDNDLTLMIRLQEENQIISGNGTGENLTGFLSHANLQSQAFSTNNADTVMKAITKVSWTGYGTATGVIMNPANWETIRLLKGATNLDYVLGSPLIDVVPRLFGVPVIITNAIAAGTALVGDFVLYSHLWRHDGIQVDMTDSHSDFFIYNKFVIRAEEYVALQIKRGSAFVQCTGLT